MASKKELKRRDRLNALHIAMDNSTRTGRNKTADVLAAAKRFLKFIRKP